MLLILSPRSPFLSQVETSLRRFGIQTTTTHLQLLTQLDLFSELLLHYPYVARIENECLSFFLNNLQIQKGIRYATEWQLPVPDMWVQFGSKLRIMRQSDLSPEEVAEQIWQELVDDHRLISERKEDAVI